MKATVRTVSHVLAVAACMALAMSLPGCWGKKKEEPVTPPPVAAKPAEKAKPGANDVLKLAPEQAALAVAAPNPQRLFDRAVKLAKRVSGDEAAIDKAVKDEVAELAAKLKTPQATTFAEVLRAKGVDPEGPLAVYLDISPTVDAIQKKAAEPQPLNAPREEPESATPDKKPADGDAEPKDAPKEPAPDTHDMTPPGVVVALTCADAKLVEKSVREIAAEAHGANAQPQESDVNGVHLVTYNPATFSYFIQDNVLMIGNSVELLKSVAGRFKAPAEVRYGSKTFPASDDDQLVQLVRLDRLKPLLDGASPWAVGLPGGGAFMAALENQDTLKAMSGPDPMVVTVSLNDEKLDVVGRVDTETHPALAQLTGPAQPLRLAAMLPESTLALLSIRFNEETKATLNKALVSSMGGGAKDDPGAAGAMGAGAMALNMIGDEVTLGITGMGNGMPKAVALAALANPEQTQGMLQQFGVKTGGGEQYAGVEIAQVPVMFASVYYAFVDKTLAAATDMDQLKAAIDTLKAGNKTNLFASFKPAFDPATPRYGTFLLRGKLVDEVVKPMMQQTSQGAPPESSKELDRAGQLVRDIRISHDLNGQVHERRLTVNFN